MRKKVVSQLVATVILIAIVVVGGIVTYVALNSTANVATQRVQVTSTNISARKYTVVKTYTVLILATASREQQSRTPRR